MSDLLCVPFRPGWQVGISERRNLCRPGGAAPCGVAGKFRSLACAAGLDEDGLQLVVKLPGRFWNWTGPEFALQKQS
jgi:hypothetical protein